METVSAIVTAYNYAHYLPDALNCLLAQTFPLHEIIVVNDASTDNTEEVASGMIDAASKSPGDKRITPIPSMTLVSHIENQGLPVARNTGIAQSTGSHILILDADDAVSLSFVEKCIAFLRSNPSWSGVYTWQKWFGSPEFCLGQVNKNPPWNYSSLLGGNFMNDCSLYKRGVWKDIRARNGYGYDPDMWGWCGWEFYIHAGKLGHEWGLVPEPLYWWRRGHKAEGGQPTLGGRAWGNKAELFGKIRSKHPGLYK